MMALAADRSRKRAAEIVVGFQATNQRSEIVARRLAELGARPVVDVDPVDAGKHGPASRPACSAA